MTIRLFTVSQAYHTYDQKKHFEESSSVTKQQSAGGGVKSAFGDDLPTFTPIDLQAPPVEAHLLQNTLWPETQKLYGHGYELYCVASSPSGRYIASACKATKPEHAAIRIWSTSSWRQVTTLTLHSLTVTQLTFSHSGHYLLAVSRDRCWSLWKLNDSDDSLEVTMEAHTDKSIRSHTRIIWACSWSHDDQCFATASRDKKVCLWGRDGCVSGKECGGGWRLGAPPLECESAVTAVDFAPRMTSDNRHVLAVGLEDGQITLYTCPTPSHTLSPDNFWSSLLTVSPSHCHTSSIKRLKWRPLPNQVQSEIKLSETTAKENKGADSKSTVQAEDNERSVSVKSDVDCDGLCLASCSTDHCVKVFSITNLSLI